MIQLQVLNKLLDTQDSSIILINNITDEFFSDYKEEFNYIKTFIDTYSKVPDKETFLSKFPHFDMIKVSEPTSYLLDELYKDRNSRFLASTFNDVRAKVLSGNIDDAMSVYLKASEQLSKAKHLDCIDILQNTDERYNAYVERCNDFDKYYVKTGFSELDEIIGGWDRQEELATIAARTNQGKSWILFKMANAAVAQGLRVGIYEGEMSANKVGYRFDTMAGHISNSGLIRGHRDVQAKYKKYLDELKIKYPNSCCKVLTPAMIDGPAGVTALRAFIEKENLDILFVDQHSLLEDDRHAKNPVEKAANISKDLKNLQVLKKIPIIAVSQQNRASTENGVGTEHIAQSDRISQDSTIIIFFEQNKEHTLLTMQLVKSRDSVNMKKLQYAFDFDKGIFVFIPETDDELNESDVIAQLNAKRAEILRKEFADEFTTGENIF